MTRTPILGVLATLAFEAAPGLRGQNADGVRFILATRDGKTSFRVGEAVEVEFRFEASVPAKYGAWPRRPTRYARQPEYDYFAIEPLNGSPADAVIDPLADIFTPGAGGGVSGRPPMPSPLGGAPVVVGLQVNEWLSIRKPGHYRITADTTRVVTTAPPSTPVPLHSNSIEIDVVAPEAGWAAAQLRKAVAVLQIPDLPPGRSLDLRSLQLQRDNAAAAARTVRFLETPEAAQALAQFYEHGPEYAQSELRAGLFGSPYREQVIADMEAAVAAPDIPITNSYLGTLIDLAELTRFGPTPPYTAEGTEEIRRWIEEVERPYQEKAKPVISEYVVKLADAIGQKRGQALAISQETIVTREQQRLSLQSAGQLVGQTSGQVTPSASTKALAANFLQLPENSQNTFLTINWAQIASPDMAPVLQSMAEGDSPLRDRALQRLQELDPEAARKITLDRIQKAVTLDPLQKADVDTRRYSSARVLLTLPDKTLPAMDDALVAAIERNAPAQALVARYASAAALPRLKAWVDQQPVRMCGTVLSAYFFRVDAEWAAGALARARQIAGSSGRRGACSPVNLGPTEDLFMSPGLEKQAIEDLSNSDTTIVRSAVTLLQYAGSAAAEKPLLEAFARLHAAGVNTDDPLSLNLDGAFAAALLSANRWVPSESTFTQALAGCITDQCSRQVASARRPLTPPIIVSIGSQMLDGIGSPIGLGSGMRSVKQFREKIAQFPQGTEFAVSGNKGTWYYEHYVAEARKMLEDAGMKVVDRPAPAAR